MAQAYLLARDFPRAEAALEQIIPHDQFPRTILERRAVWVRGELALALHKPESALRLADGLLASAPGEEQRARGQPIPALLKLRGEALCALGQVDEAMQALEEARQGAQEQSARPLLWQIHRSLARVYTAAKQKDLAHRACVATRETITDVATSVEDVTAREHFLHTALASLPEEQPLTARQSAKQAFDGLSNRELEVALLIAQGKFEPRDCRGVSYQPAYRRRPRREYLLQVGIQLARSNCRLDYRKGPVAFTHRLMGLSKQPSRFMWPT